ncbi:MAG: 30S ribosomal protein S3 [Thermodesulfobacteriota bacterium]|jgi:small subunit ribosomal protein S3|nr:30S ribosomal protein S3 [bacterium]MBT3850434.1 30S ribosomal protein S3 [bacterium]MBT4434825.1 30S ribosomal protein S3 [bacterium]MDG2446037.1 30S ribosomal protein S3 [Thermodesulfobacteriota bacterium]NSW99424.1 30S ribosomal protein S3 [bacterium]|tara:strand:- start:320 stop:991 length:672 start_codon:yes stop_codon:yes gene_type:complete
MGQKVNPISLRIGITRGWTSNWFVANKTTYKEFLHEDLKIRTFIKKTFFQSGISKMEIERSSNDKIRIVIFCSKPGLLIGRKGADIDLLRKNLSKMVNKEILIDIKEVKRPEVDSQLVAENIALQLERRVAYRRAMKRSLTSALRLGAIGIKVMVSGRLNGAEIARSEWYREGRVPLSTLRADIDYGFAEAATTYGKIGIKVWIFKGEVLRKKNLKGATNATA